MVDRRRAAVARTSTAQNAVKSSLTGEEGRRRILEEADRREAEREANKSLVYTPFRFFLRPGETTQIIIVDEAPNFFRYEHDLQNKRDGRWDLHVPCIAEYANCPACVSSGKQGQYRMYLTIIDLTEFTGKNGTRTWSKKLYVAPASVQKKIMRIFEREGTLRGAVIEVSRDGDKDPRAGNDLQLQEFAPEEELAGYVETYETKDGEEMETIGGEVYNYDELFPDLSEEQLEVIVGTKADISSSRYESSRIGGNSSRMPARTPARASARAPARGASGDSFDDDGDSSAPAPRASSRVARGAPSQPAPSAAPARSPIRRAPASASEGSDEEARPSRLAARRVAPSSSAAVAEDDSAPASSRPASSLAARRAHLRRG